MSAFLVRNPDFRAAIADKMTRQHFLHLIGLDLIEIEPGRVVGYLPLETRHQQQAGFAHGGLVAAVADTVAGFAAVTLARIGEQVVTVELKISYLHPGIGTALRGIGTVLKAGNTLSFTEAEIWCERAGQPDLLIAKASATMMAFRPSAT
ncbi:MAG: PaaI family thioesterase [Hymenobacteraceae bacterium]|nr:PaaI family thioesterase [Hymenobacteraceae bacterium]